MTLSTQNRVSTSQYLHMIRWHEHIPCLTWVRPHRNNNTSSISIWFQKRLLPCHYILTTHYKHVRSDGMKVIIPSFVTNLWQKKCQRASVQNRQAYRQKGDRQVINDEVNNTSKHLKMNWTIVKRQKKTFVGCSLQRATYAAQETVTTRI